MLQIRDFFSPLGCVALLGHAQNLKNGKFLNFEVEPADNSEAIIEDGEAIIEDGEAIIEDGEAIIEDGEAIKESKPLSNRQIFEMLEVKIPKNSKAIELDSLTIMGKLPILFKIASKIEMPITLENDSDAINFVEKWDAFKSESLSNFIAQKSYQPKGFSHYFQGNPLFLPTGHGVELTGTNDYMKDLLSRALVWKTEDDSITIIDCKWDKAVKHFDSITIEMHSKTIKLQKVESPKKGEAGFTISYDSKTIDKNSKAKPFKSPTFREVESTLIELYASIIVEQELNPEE